MKKINAFDAGYKVMKLLDNYSKNVLYCMLTTEKIYKNSVPSRLSVYCLNTNSGIEYITNKPDPGFNWGYLIFVKPIKLNALSFVADGTINKIKMISLCPEVNEGDYNLIRDEEIANVKLTFSSALRAIEVRQQQYDSTKEDQLKKNKSYKYTNITNAINDILNLSGKEMDRIAKMDILRVYTNDHKYANDLYEEYLEYVFLRVLKFRIYKYDDDSCYDYVNIGNYNDHSEFSLYVAQDALLEFNKRFIAILDKRIKTGLSKFSIASIYNQYEEENLKFLAYLRIWLNTMTKSNISKRLKNILQRKYITNG